MSGGLQVERALAASGQPARLHRRAGTVDVHGVLSRTTIELLDGDRQPMTTLTVPVASVEGLLEGDKVEVGGRDWTVARVEANLHTASIQFREASRAV